MAPVHLTILKTKDVIKKINSENKPQNCCKNLQKEWAEKLSSATILQESLRPSEKTIFFPADTWKLSENEAAQISEGRMFQSLSIGARRVLQGRDFHRWSASVDLVMFSSFHPHHP